MKVLVVDDDRQILGMLESFLTKVGWTVVTAESPETADSHLDSSVDVVLSDLSMEGFNGIDFMREVHARFPALEVVLMSGHEELQRTSQDEGIEAFGYIRKPFDIPLLNRTLFAAVRSKDLKAVHREASCTGLKQILTRRVIQLGELMSTMGHELNQPLNAFSSYVQLMKYRLDSGRQTPVEEQSQLCRDMLEEIERMKRVLAGVRKLTLNARNVSRPSPSSVSEVYHKNLSDIKASIRESDIALEEDIATDLPSILTDSDRLAVLLRNLLLTVLEKDIVTGDMDTSGKKVSIRVSVGPHAREEKPGVSIVVQGKVSEDSDREEDTGMEPEPAEESLGTAILQGIVRNMSGTLEVKSQPGCTRKLTVWLPAIENEERYGAAD